jgi:hypothetical protein
MTRATHSSTASNLATIEPTSWGTKLDHCIVWFNWLWLNKLPLALPPTPCVHDIYAEQLRASLVLIYHRYRLYQKVQRLRASTKE